MGNDFNFYPLFLILSGHTRQAVPYLKFKIIITY